MFPWESVIVSSLDPGERTASHSLVPTRIREALLSSALRKSDAFTQEKWEEIQRRKLRQILLHAKRTVPFWKKKLPDIPETFEALQTLLQGIPPVSRSLLKQLRPEEYMSDSLPRARFLKNSTSGSTGEPLVFFQDTREGALRRAWIATEFHYNQITFTRPALVLGLSTHTYLDPAAQRFLGTQIENLEGRQRLWEYIAQYKPSVLLSTPSILERLVHYARIEGARPRFSGVKTIGETLTPERQEALSSFFGCRVFAGYGTREAAGIATQCSHNNFHRDVWLNHVDILNSQGRPVPMGEEGSIVVTYFENFAMPFIRYAIGDRGRISLDRCPCGRVTPLIIFSGREAGLIPLNDGTAVSALAISSLIASHYASTISKFQVLRCGKTIQMRCLTRGSFGTQTRASLAQSLGRLLKAQYAIDIRETEAFVSRNDKTPPFLEVSTLEDAL